MAASSSTPIHLMVSEKNGSGQQPNRNNYNGVNGDDLGELVERTDSTTSSSSSWDLLQSDSQEPVTIVDLGSDEAPSGYGTPVNSKSELKATNESDFIENMRAKMMEEVGGQMWNAGKQSARKFYDLYANIDFLRPYFDVEPKDVLKRLVQSLIPHKPSKPQTVPGELYGPIMLVFTLIALLLFSMKSSGHTVQEGTLMGTAISVCFGYWLGFSCFYYFLAYICNSHITLLQILTLTGYGLFGHCVAIFVTTVTHSNSHFVFYVFWLLFGGLSSLKMVGVYVSRTWSKKNGLIVGIIVTAFHLLFLIYLHFAYHSVYEDAAMLLSRTKREIVPVTRTDVFIYESTNNLADDLISMVPMKLKALPGDTASTVAW